MTLRLCDPDSYRDFESLREAFFLLTKVSQIHAKHHPVSLMHPLILQYGRDKTP
jgi:hypothetical protein